MNSYKNIPAMTPQAVHDYLNKIGREWTGQGTAVELGSWLGASAAALLDGLKEAGYDKTFWAFERWVANAQQVNMTRDNIKLELNQDVKPIFLRNVTKIYDRVAAIKGNLPLSLGAYNDGPIELCLFDAPKSDPVFVNCVNELCVHWIPGVTILGLLDYKFYQRHNGVRREELMAPVRFMRIHGHHFKWLKDWENDVTTAVFFRYEKELRF